MADSDPRLYVTTQLCPACAEHELSNVDKTSLLVALSAEAGYVLVRISINAMVGLAERETDPLAVIGLSPNGDDTFELVLRRPSRKELRDSLNARFRGKND